MTFPYTLPRLPYPTGALEPNLNRATIMTHHDKIFASHADALNCTLQPYPTLQKQPLPQLLLHPGPGCPAPSGRMCWSTAGPYITTHCISPPWPLPVYPARGRPHRGH